MAGMLEASKLSLDGKHHSGIDDCRNIGKLVRFIVEREGARFMQPTMKVERQGGEVVLKRQNLKGMKARYVEGAEAAPPKSSKKEKDESTKKSDKMNKEESTEKAEASKKGEGKKKKGEAKKDEAKPKPKEEKAEGVELSKSQKQRLKKKEAEAAAVDADKKPSKKDEAKGKGKDSKKEEP